MNSENIHGKPLPYEPDEFADRHGLTVKAAHAVLFANHRSREQADRGAELFKQASAARSKQALALPSLYGLRSTRHRDRVQPVAWSNR